MSDENLRLGQWLIEPSRNCITDGDETRALEPRLMDVLVHLATNAPRTISSHELLDHFWIGRVVESSTVHQAIDEIRVALGDRAKSPDYLETVSRHAYRIVAPVEWVKADGTTYYSAQPSGTLLVGPGGAPASLEEQTNLLGIGRIQLSRKALLIGRARSCDITLADSSVSKKHARLALRKKRWGIEDLGSTNGIAVNGKLIDAVMLADGDLIRLGRILLRFDAN